MREVAHKWEDQNKFRGCQILKNVMNREDNLY